MNQDARMDALLSEMERMEAINSATRRKLFFRSFPNYSGTKTPEAIKKDNNRRRNKAARKQRSKQKKGA